MMQKLGSIGISGTIVKKKLYDRVSVLAPRTTRG